MRWANSESLLSEPTGEKGTNYRWEMNKVSRILSNLAKGKSLYDCNFEDVKSALSSVGIEEGVFTIDAGAGEHHYILDDTGYVTYLDRRIEFFNTNNWLNQGYQPGDVFNIYGKEYPIDENGHLHVSVTDEFTTSDVIYPTRTSEIL